jgi:arabinose-5-phosphate isomerase
MSAIEAFHDTPATPGDVLATALRTVDIEIRGLARMRETLQDGALAKAFAQAVETIFQASGRVIVTGMGKSGHIGCKIAATLASTGTPASFVHPAEASHGDLGMITSGDVILALSWSGETGELRDIIHYSRRYGVPLLALTSGASSSLGKAADAALILPKVEEACPHGLAPTSSTTLQLALGDALAMALLERRGFTPAHFRQFHPGGKLGARLLTVRDVMVKAPDLPLVGRDAPMSEVLLAMSKGRLGCAIIVDGDEKLAGIVTDGDLRRHMGPELMMRPVTEVMTATPRTTSPATLASATLKEMSERKISVLIAVEDDAPVGIVHLQNLLQAGLS